MKEDDHRQRSRYEIIDRLMDEGEGCEDTASQPETNTHPTHHHDFGPTSFHPHATHTSNFTRSGPNTACAASLMGIGAAELSKAAHKNWCEDKNSWYEGACDGCYKWHSCSWQDRTDSGVSMAESVPCESRACSSAMSTISSQNPAECAEPDRRSQVPIKSSEECHYTSGIAHPRPSRGRATNRKLEELYQQVEHRDIPRQTGIDKLTYLHHLLHRALPKRSLSAPPRHELLRPWQVFSGTFPGRNDLVFGSSSASYDDWANNTSCGQHSGFNTGPSDRGLDQGGRALQQQDNANEPAKYAGIAQHGPKNKSPEGDGPGNFNCIFCAAPGRRNPTNKCWKSRPFTSRLKKHHCHSKHPGGPFACCQKCFAIGTIRTEGQEFVRFRTLEEVTAHEANCTLLICIDEDCTNFDIEQNTHCKCDHELRKQRDIWQMWYRRAYDLRRGDPVPEPHDPHPPPGYQYPQQQQRQQTSRLPVPAPLGLSRLTSGSALLNSQASPAATSPAPFGTQSRASSTMSTPASPLEGLARGLLSRVIAESPSWSNVLSQLYDSTVPSSRRRMESIQASDPETAERIRTLQVLVETCRNLLTRRSIRSPEMWSDLRVAVSTAMFEPLAEHPPHNWIAPLGGIGTARGQMDSFAPAPYGSAANAMGEINASASNMPVGGMSEDSFDSSVFTLVEASNITYEQTRNEYPQPPRTRYANVGEATAAAADARSMQSGSSFSGYYSTQGSANGKRRAPDGRPSFDASNAPW